MAIVRDGGDRLRLGGPGDIIEWAVHLRRFHETRTLDILADRGALGPDVIQDLATAVLNSHRRAELRDGLAATAALMRQASETVTELRESLDKASVQLVESFGDTLLKTLHALKPLLKHRGQMGKVRRCHGDLHWRNIVLLDGSPVLFDTIEFDEAIATCDILYDLAFLLMDLWQRGLQFQSNLLLNRYLSGCDDIERELTDLAALPAFLALRAAIRAKVAIELARISPPAEERSCAEARHYLAAACELLAHRPLRLVGIGGLSGAGKTTIARQAAPCIGRPPGAVHLRSDILRKRLFKAGEYERLTETAYDPQVTEAIYRQLRSLAGIALRAGQSVIVDAVHLHQDGREKFSDLAREAESSFVGLWLEAPVALLQERVAARQFDASDATPEIVGRQARHSADIQDWQRLDASQPPAVLARKVAAAAQQDCNQVGGTRTAAP